MKKAQTISIFAITIVLLLVSSALSVDIDLTMVDSQTLEKGVVLEKYIFMDGSDEGKAFCLRANIGDKHLKARPVLAGGAIAGSRETVRAMAGAHRAIAGINVSYYGHFKSEVPTGDLLAQLIIGREVVSTKNVFYDHDAVLALYDTGELIFFEPAELEARIIFPDGSDASDVLVNPLMWRDGDSLLFTRRVGKVPPAGFDRSIYLYKTHDSDPLYIGAVNKAKLANTLSGSPEIPEDGFLMVLGSGAQQLLRKNDDIQIQISFKNDALNKASHIIGGPALSIKDGKVLFEEGVMEPEKRAMIGNDVDGNLCFLVCSPVDWYTSALVARKIGLVNALMVDGGDSANISYQNRSVFEVERAVGDALLLFYEA